MSQPEVFILHCSVSASVRQSVQIAFKDYKLPDDVIDTLKKANANSIRPKLSNALRQHLEEVRIMQRYLYDRCTIHHGDVHFLHPDYFEEAMQRIEEIKKHVDVCNAKLKDSWHEELQQWQGTVDNFFSPLFTDPEQLLLVREAYMKMFPTKEEFSSPIMVDVVGPYPASLERVDDPEDIKSLIQNQAALNTEKVLEAARKGSLDDSLGKVANLIDDLDARPAHKVTDQVLSANPKKRGSWQVIASDLSLSAAHNPLLLPITKLCRDLIKVGNRMKSLPQGVDRLREFEKYAEIREDIRDEAVKLTKKQDSSEGFEALQMSLTLSNTYQNLIHNLATCDPNDDLQTFEKEVEEQLGTYKHRAAHLRKLFKKTKDRLDIESFSETTLEELENSTVQSEDDCGF